MMIFVNALFKANSLYKPYMVNFLKMFGCVCPFVAEELFELTTGKQLFDYEMWPTCDEAKLVQNTVKIAVSVNGKLRATLEVEVDLDDETLKAKAFELEGVKRHIEGKEIKRVIIVKNKIVNIVAI